MAKFLKNIQMKSLVTKRDKGQSKKIELHPQKHRR